MTNTEKMQEARRWLAEETIEARVALDLSQHEAVVLVLCAGLVKAAVENNRELNELIKQILADSE